MVKREPTEKTEPSTPKAKSAKTTTKTVFKPLAIEENASVPIDVSYAGETANATTLPKNEGFGLELKVRSSRGFSATSTVYITDGKYAGYAAVLFKPEAPFRFLDLPLELRIRIQKMVLLPGESVQIKAKTGISSGVIAPGYTAKNGFGLLGVNKQIRAETMPIAYGMIAVSATGSSILVKFLLTIGSIARGHLRELSVTHYARKDIQMLFILLADCKNLSRLHLIDYPLAGSPAKIAKAFTMDAGTWLSSRVSMVGKNEAVKPLKFGPQALKNGSKAFTKNEKILFYEELHKKL